MGNYHNTAVVLKNKRDFDIAWKIASESDSINGGVGAQIHYGFIINFDIKYDMDWGLIRKISKAVENEISVYTYYDGDGSAMVTTYSAGKRQSQKELDESDVEYWQALIYIFGNIDWCCPLEGEKELVIRSNYRYSALITIMIVDHENHTFERLGSYCLIENLPKVVEEQTTKAERSSQ